MRMQNFHHPKSGSWSRMISASEVSVRLLRVGSGRLQASWRVELAPFEVLDEGATEDAIPSIEVGQLLRSFAQGGEEGGNTGERTARTTALTVHTADRHSGASGMVGLSTNRLKQQRATGDCLAVMVRISQTHEEVPPVEDEGDNTCHDPAARHVVGGKSAPPPVVLQLVEAVLTIAAVSVELTDGQNLGI